LIRVLLVDDSNSVRAVLRRFFARTPDVSVVAEAVDGEEAVAAVREHRPHAVVMDLQMPGMDGYVAIERIMAERPTPIIVLSSRATRNQMQTAFEAMRRGAIEVLPKPEDTASWELLAESLPRMVRLVTEVRAAPAVAPRRRDGAPAEPPPLAVASGPRSLRWVAIGASTGGPAAIRAFLEEIPGDLPVTFLIVQHIASGFESGFAEWLNKEFTFDVRLARDGERPGVGAVRIAPADAHLVLSRGGVLHLDRESPARRGHRPSVDDLFSSCAEIAPTATAGVLLTGMGSDGVDGLLALRQAGGLTLVQDEASSIVFGMPRVALERGATEVAMPPRDLAGPPVEERRMSAPPPPSPILQQFVALLRDRTGNLVPPGRFGFLEEVAERRAKAVGLASTGEYVGALAAGALPREWGSLVSLLTIKESYFFRAPQQFEAVRRVALPQLLARGKRPLRFWSAACARGEEPATLALVLSEEKALAGWDWRILATDLDAEALGVAGRGMYGERAVAQVPPHLLSRYFHKRGKMFELSREILARIDFAEANLAEPPFPLPEPSYDLIFLRNLLIYFRRPLQTRVMAHVARLLHPDGALFLGATETLWQIQDELEAVDLGDCFSYRHRKAPLEKPAPPPAALPRAVERRPDPARPASAPAASPAPPSAAAPFDPSDDRTPPIAPAGVPERLLGAARHLAANRPAEARQTVDAILASDPSEPAAHVLDGFLHDLAGKTEDAAASYRAALYLDPALFQARLLLADGLLRLGQAGRAEHQYREVLTTLDGGRERQLVVFEDLPFPDPERARRRCRQVLSGGVGGAAGAR
jgi:two-component system chemotaxis response regulator CheB